MNNMNKNWRRTQRRKKERLHRPWLKQLNLNDVPLDGEDEVDGGVGEETEEEEEIDLMSWPVHGSKKR